MMSVGDVVVLKSGGLRMTVEGFDVNPYMQPEEWAVRCVWILDEGPLHRASFRPEVLKPCD